MGIVDSIRSGLRGFLGLEEAGDAELRQRSGRYDLWDSYYHGEQRRQLRVKPNQADDNLAINFVKLAVERGISMMLKGVKFEAGEAETQAYLEAVWKANRGRILLHKAAQNAAKFGTGYFKIIPDGVESRDEAGVRLPRLVALNPRWMTIHTQAEDVDQVAAYEMRYNLGEDRARKEITRAVYSQQGEAYSLQPTADRGQGTGEDLVQDAIAYWVVEEWVLDRGTGGVWKQVSSTTWEWEFPPIVHWQNLPEANACYGQSDIEDIVDLQDRNNFVASNISRIIRYHAHPRTWGRGASGQSVSWGPDEMVWLPGENSQVQNLEMQSDLGSSRAFYSDLRQALFDLSRTVDISSIKDRVGALTNFGLRVLYIDSLDKVDTKRALLGEALLEVERRVLALAGMRGKPGQIVWGDPLPVDEVGAAASDGFELSNGLVSKQTISKRRGYDWEKEQALMEEERASEDTVGGMILKAFNQGQPTGGSRQGEADSLQPTANGGKPTAYDLQEARQSEMGTERGVR